MKIAHIAIWTAHLDELREFYTTYFGGVAQEKYINPAKGFESYTLSFESECRLELMRKSNIYGTVVGAQVGLAHFAFGCANKEEVIELTERLRLDEYQIVGEPRITGDGLFESLVADPDGNLVEITC